jgi:hypothetical protein
MVGGEVLKSNPAELPKYHLLNSFWLKNKLELKTKNRVLIILIFFIKIVLSVEAPTEPFPKERAGLPDIKRKPKSAIIL